MAGRVLLVMKKTFRKRFSTVLLSLTLLAGLSLLLYPSFSDWFNHLEARRIQQSLEQELANIPEDQFQMYWQQAEDYNNRLNTKADRFNLSDSEKEEYSQTLLLPTTEVMGMIEIPSIDVNLPIYHGTSENVLQKYIGHLEGTSLPTGGQGRHAVLSGHRGLPSAKLFTDIDQLQENDYFIVTLLGQKMTYQVDKISIIEPTDYSEFAIDPDQDYVTLMTCTPYGINTHRLLVRGHRVDNLPDDFIYTQNEAGMIDRSLVAVIFFGVLLGGYFIVTWIRSSYQSSKRKKEGAQ